MYVISFRYSPTQICSLSKKTDGNGNIKNAEFRCEEQNPDTFWIRGTMSNMYKIGFDDCPLYWSGNGGLTRNAEFRCGPNEKGDDFWIKGWKSNHTSSSKTSAIIFEYLLYFNHC